MGVPGFFSWILSRWDKTDIILEVLPSKTSIDILYLDANCLIHPQCFNILHKLDKITPVKELENLMIAQIINYINYLINYANPKSYTYIAIDGVAPQAKMDQQRKRRFRSSQDSSFRRDIQTKHKQPNYSDWSNTVITPGTEFMEELHQAILAHIKTNKRKIIYSSYHTPGEGEHKILQDLKLASGITSCIYGLDADLIFLALASNRPNLFLLREAFELTQVTGKRAIQPDNRDLNYINISKVRDCINSHFNSMFTKKNAKVQNLDFVDDFIVICYLLGNDFLPHLPSIDVKTNGLDFLMNSYVDLFLETKQHIITRLPTNTIQIDVIVLDLLLKKISEGEIYYFREILPNYLEKCRNRKVPVLDPYAKEIWEIDNLKNIHEHDPIRLGDGKPIHWRYRYYYHHMRVANYQQELIQDMCKQYLIGVIWVARYYFESIASWEWQYPYTHAPFVSDLANYSDISKFDLNTVIFEKSEPSEPFVQLLAVLPPACADILPKNYRTLVLDDSPIIDMFPSHIEVDTLYKDMFWKCIALIPIVDIIRIRQITSKIVITEAEKTRNIIQPVFTN